MMIFTHLFVFLCGISACFIASTVATEAIVGGDIDEYNHFPYQVTLQTHSQGSICGGGILDEHFILTAAHCVLQKNGQFDNESILILAGTNDLDKLDKPAVAVEVKKIYVPEEFKPPFTTSTGDIAVLRLKYPLALSHHLTKLELPKHKDDDYSNKVAKIAGFGMDWMKLVDGKETGGYTDTRLRFAEAHVITNDECQNGYLHKHIFKKYICARVRQHHNHNRGVCEGDSGGPLVHNHTAIGILSMNPIGCTEEIKAGIYTRVSNYLTFIEHAKQDKKSNDIREHEFH